MIAQMDANHWEAHTGLFSHSGIVEPMFVKWLLQVARGHPGVQVPLGGFSTHISMSDPQCGRREREVS